MPDGEPVLTLSDLNEFEGRYGTAEGLLERASKHGCGCRCRRTSARSTDSPSSSSPRRTPTEEYHSSRAALASPILARPLGVPGKSHRACRQAQNATGGAEHECINCAAGRS